MRASSSKRPPPKKFETFRNLVSELERKSRATLCQVVARISDNGTTSVMGTCGHAFRLDLFSRDQRDLQELARISLRYRYAQKTTEAN